MRKCQISKLARSSAPINLFFLNSPFDFPPPPSNIYACDPKLRTMSTKNGQWMEKLV